MISYQEYVLVAESHLTVCLYHASVLVSSMIDDGDCDPDMLYVSL